MSLQVLFAGAAASTGTGGSSVGMYVGIAISIVVVLVLSVLLSIWCVRHRRLQRSFLDFTSSHYNTRTDNATFSNGELFISNHILYINVFVTNFMVVLYEQLVWFVGLLT